MRTWHIETAVVATVLLLVWAATSFQPKELIGVTAVLFTFMHAQVANRMAERQALQTKPDVECYRWNVRYHVAKELCWLGYFLLTESWSALAGVGLFLVHPLWRAWYRKHYPLT